MDRSLAPTGHSYKDIVANDNAQVYNGDYYAQGSITIVNTTGTVANILDILGTTLGKVHESHAGGGTSIEIGTLHFETLLETWRTALTKLHEWLESDLDDEHYLLKMGLDKSLTLSRLLITQIDVQLGHQPSSQASTSPRSDELQRMIEGQITALNLHLTVFSCTTASQKENILKSKSTRKLMTRLEKDTASLIVHRDDRSSIRSRMTGLSSASKFSTVFAFDKEMWLTDVYDRFIRHTVKENARAQKENVPQLRAVDTRATVTNPSSSKQTTQIQQDTTEQPNDLGVSSFPIRPSDSTAHGHASQTSEVRIPRTSRGDKASHTRSRRIDQGLEADAKRLRRQCDVLLIGTSDHDVDVLLEHLLLLYDPGEKQYTATELLIYRQIVCRTLVQYAKAIAHAAMESESPAGEISRRRIEAILSCAVDPDPAIPLNADYGLAVTWLWTEYADCRQDLFMPHYASYFLEKADRICMSTYKPSGEDVLKVRSSMNEVKIQMGALSVNLTRVKQENRERKNVLAMFEHVTSIIFCVDLSRYDVPWLDTANGLMEPLVFFDSVVNSRWFMRASVILLLGNAGSFRAKMAHSPLKQYFPDYNGGDDLNRGAKYILWRFHQLNRARLALYPHLLELDDVTSLRVIFAAIKETILRNAMQDIGIKGLE
ncbi:unnamed protein product [Zymoseptoria tritici ST99CH_3D7]|uniref:Uncharacterized protein n=1 Tax=Zymoseptoria tritici (strain ST99CH_3D7) TaxID=1276538 RepID=A0A1X7S180_ZYMT9|nr:unnamed protein product [Zymoseptoria tritici ST99CH_3D7]